jgi:glycosyltransferase involved in cell wall biosynthesis
LDAALKIGPDQNLEFHFWGGGDLVESYQQEHQGQSHIFFHGHLERQQLFQEVRKAHLLILATDESVLWKYGQSLNKMVEYMMMGRPVIASYSGYPSMINEAGSGVFVEAGDSTALMQTLLDFGSLPRKELERLGRKGRKWVVSHRGYAQLSKEYLEILDSL